MSNPRPTRDEVLAILARRFDVPNLRSQIRNAQALLVELAEFERLWDLFVAQLRQIFEACGGNGQAMGNPKFEEPLRDAERLRLDLASRQATVLQTYREPLAQFLRTSVRAPSVPLLQLIGETRVEGGRTLVPMDEWGGSEFKISLRQFETQADEARNEIAIRRRDLEAQIRIQQIALEEAEQAIREDHAHELEKIRAASFWRLVSRKFRGTRLGKLVWWFIEEPVRNLIWLLALVVVFTAVPSLRGCVAGAGAWLKSHADTTAHARKP